MIRTRSIIYFLSLQPFISECLANTDYFPSCLESGATWQEENILTVTSNILTPEDCQTTCLGLATCTGFTRLSSQSPIFPLGCFLFSQTVVEEDVPCDNCVSGPPQCLCLVQGECAQQDDNILQV